MQNLRKMLALVLGSVMALSVFAGCGDSGKDDKDDNTGDNTQQGSGNQGSGSGSGSGNQGSGGEDSGSGSGSGNQGSGGEDSGNQGSGNQGSGGGTQDYGESFGRICFDNLPDDDIEIAEDETKIHIGAVDDDSMRAVINGKSQKDYSSVATYENGVLTAKGAGVITFKQNGVRGRVDVVPAYVTDPGNQYKNLTTDLQLNSSKLLGNTHDPSLIEVSDTAKSTYYIFSTGWGGGNDIHSSEDLIHWDYLGKSVHGNSAEVIPDGLREWANLKAGEGTESIQWWAPDIVPAKGGGYWLYTCTVQPNDHMRTLSAKDFDGAQSPSGTYSQASIVLYWAEDLKSTEDYWTKNSFEYKGVLMQSAIPQGDAGNIDINSIDPQIIYSEDGKMYMAYGSFGTGNWLLELDPETGLRKDDVYQDGQFKSVGYVRRERNKVVSGDETKSTGTKYLDDYLAGKEVKSDYYGRLISLGAMEAPVLARQDNVTVMDENETVLEENKTFFYSMHSYNWLASNYQMWGGRSESVWGAYKSVSGGLVYNVNAGDSKNQGNKYMGAFRWREASKAEGCTEINIALPGHNDVFTTTTGLDLAAYITRTWDTGSERFCVQLHQYYLNSYGDICISPNRYSGEIDRTVTKEELLKYTDNGRFEMVVLANQEDAVIESAGNNAKLKKYNTESVEVKLTEDGKIMQNTAQIGKWMMYGKGYIKLEFTNSLKATSGADSMEKVYYGVVRPAWLGNRNQSGFTITAMGHTDGKNMNMPLFLNNYSTLEGEGFVGGTK